MNADVRDFLILVGLVMSVYIAGVVVLVNLAMRDQGYVSVKRALITAVWFLWLVFVGLVFACDPLQRERTWWW